MSLRNLLAGSCACALFTLTSFAAAPPVEVHTVNRITDAAFNHGEVVDIAAYLADQIGGRMTNSPAMRKAERWTQSEFKSWGLKDVRAEGFDFGRGWWIESSHVRMTAPRPLELRGIPIAWTPATNGAVNAPVIVAPMISDKDFADWKGKLSGKIVLVTWPAPPKDDADAPFQRLSDADIAKLDKYQQPAFDPEAR
ncbi:MAG: carboxypeptidase, partial [Gammaproteobacteria bacterium]|nr:carboxypeptidase [Gammaproteobacteria bacterium]